LQRAVHPEEAGAVVPAVLLPRVQAEGMEEEEAGDNFRKGKQGMNLLYKWLTVPKSNEVTQKQAVQLWEVRWRSRHGDFHADTRPEVECFTSEQEAEDFAQALRQAFALIRHRSGNRISVERAKS
jgi:hypothetical protein